MEWYFLHVHDAMLSAPVYQQRAFNCHGLHKPSRLNGIDPMRGLWDKFVAGQRARLRVSHGIFPSVGKAGGWISQSRRNATRSYGQSQTVDLEIGSRGCDSRSRIQAPAPFGECIILAYNCGTIRRRRSRTMLHFFLSPPPPIARFFFSAISTHRNNYHGENAFSSPTLPSFPLLLRYLRYASLLCFVYSTSRATFARTECTGSSSSHQPPETVRFCRICKRETCWRKSWEHCLWSGWCQVRGRDITNTECGLINIPCQIIISCRKVFWFNYRAESRWSALCPR